MHSALAATTTERSPIMMRDPSNPLATGYPVGTLRLTLEG